MTQLSERETQFLQLAADGYRYADIATEMHLHMSYVKRRLCEVEHKLGADSITHAVAMALRRKLIS